LSGLIEVRLLDVPLDLHARSAAHGEALQREFELIRLAEGTDDTVPSRLRRLVEDLQGRFGGLSDGPEEEMRRAREAGCQEVSLTYQVPEAAGVASAQLLAALREADDYCRAGELVTLATPPDQVAFRDWFLGEFIAQIAGAPPRSWHEVARSTEEEGSGSPEPTPTPPTATADPDGEPRAHEAGGAPGLSSVAGEGWTVERDASAPRIAFRGDLDLESAPRLRTLVADVCQHGPTSLVLDLSEVSFLDSVGLSVLLAAHARLEADDVSVEVVPSPTVRRVFELAGVAELFGI
jgi:anti-sigma B factor antagonist